MASPQTIPTALPVGEGREEVSTVAVLLPEGGRDREDEGGDGEDHRRRNTRSWPAVQVAEAGPQGHEGREADEDEREYNREERGGNRERTEKGSRMDLDRVPFHREEEEGEDARDEGDGSE